MRQEINFIGGAYLGQSTNINAQVCENLFPITDQTGGKTALALMGTPGLKLWNADGSGEVRGLYKWGDDLFAAIGNTLYKVDTDGNSTDVGTLETENGKIWMAGGTTHLCVVDPEAGKGYYRLAGATSLTQITDADFPDPSSLTYQDGYFIATEIGTDSFYISASEDASSWGGLDFASAEDTPDDALAATNHRRELWIFGEQTFEVFANTGNSAFPFSRIPGSVQKLGLGAVASLCSGPEGLFWLDSQYRPRSAQGYEAGRIAPEQIEYHIAQYENKADAVGCLYTHEGHSFYQLTFPGPSKTWVYDIGTRLWFTKSSGLAGGRHIANCAAWFAGKVIMGDWATGNLYELDSKTYTDNGAAIRRVRASQAIHNARKFITYGSFEVEFEAGVGLVTGQGSDPQAMLDWSDDGGHTWSNEHWADIGKIGKYKTRSIWRRLGSSRTRIFRVTVSDPVKVVMIGAYLDGS